MAPTFQRLTRFDRDLDALSPELRQRSRVAVGQFVADLRSGAREPHVVWRQVGTHDVLRRP